MANIRARHTRPEPAGGAGLAVCTRWVNPADQLEWAIFRAAYRKSIDAEQWLELLAGGSVFLTDSGSYVSLEVEGANR